MWLQTSRSWRKKERWRRWQKCDNDDGDNNDVNNDADDDNNDNNLCGLLCRLWSLKLIVPLYDKKNKDLN